MNDDNLLKHFDFMQFMDSSKLNALLTSKSAGNNNDFLKEHKWHRVNDTNLWALVYEDNGKKYASKINKLKDDNIEDSLGINNVEPYGGIQNKNNKKKSIKNTNKVSNNNPSGNGRRKKQTSDVSNDYSENLMGNYNK